MKQSIFLCICCVTFFTARLQAQQNHFIYLQTENKQAFYVKLDNNILSSSASGYLILSKLREGTYDFSLGFPKKEWSEQKFSCTVSKADVGYLVKNFGDKGWGLFNLQTLDVTMSANQKEQTIGKVADKTDEFSTLLSSAVNDPSILKKDAAEPVPVKTDTVKALPVETKAQQVPPPQVNVAEEKAKEIPSTKTDTKEPDEIKKIQESNAVNETSRTYIVTTNGQADTVSISIPVAADLQGAVNDAAAPKPKETDAVSVEKVVVEEASTIAKQADILKQETQPVKEKFLQIDMTPAPIKKDSAIADTEYTNAKSTPVKDAVVTKETPAVSIINSDCVSNAFEEDFLKLRKKMASASSDDDMINIAKKAFKQKCYSTDQVKNLGVLFLKDEGRYNFFDLAYPHVWDSSNYKLLESQLVDPYYANRFKAMIRH